MAHLATVAGLSARAHLSLAQTGALGVIEVVNAHMERALRVISVQRGYDPRDFTLVSFGGAGGLHAADLARTLGIPRLLIPPSAATLSAFGMLATDVIKDYVQTIMYPGETPHTELEIVIAALVEQGRSEVIAEGVPESAITLERLLDVRYRGQSYELTIPLTSNFADEFHTAHAHIYGYSEPAVPVEIVNLRLRAIGHLSRPPISPLEENAKSDPVPFDNRAVVLPTGLVTLPFYQGKQLHPGHQITGPAVITQPDTTVFIDSTDKLTVDHYRNLIIDVN